MPILFTIALILLVSYLLGCFNGSVMTSHFIIRDDVRKHGSGNAGLTNFYRTYGAKYALCVIFCDMLKMVVAGLIGGYLFRYLHGDWTLGLLLAGIGCELGHMFPVFFGFKGGKGILSGGTLVIMLDWRVALIAWRCLYCFGWSPNMCPWAPFAARLPCPSPPSFSWDITGCTLRCLWWWWV